VREDAAEAITVGTVSATAHGIPRDRALQLAMIKLLANRRVPQSSHPAVWAPFVLLDR
jgi:CHAT domain-containing protein